VGKAALRDYINATITSPELGKKLDTSSTGSTGCWGRGNPRMDRIAAILKVLQDEEHTKLRAES
jgi:hypothetical protein